MNQITRAAPVAAVSPQPHIDRLMVLSRRATRLRHFTWAARIEERAIIEVREARFQMWLGER